MLNLVRLVTSSSTSILEKSELIVRSKLSVEVILALASIPVFILLSLFSLLCFSIPEDTYGMRLKLPLDALGA